MKVLWRQNRFHDTTRFGQPEIRLYHRKAKGKRSPRYLLRCGCCEEKIERKGKRLIVHPATGSGSTTVESASSA